jgi:hypothetical protein
MSSSAIDSTAHGIRAGAKAIKFGRRGDRREVTVSGSSSAELRESRG